MPTPSRQQKYESVASQRLRDVILVLENIHDPHNAAAIMRSAESLGIQKVWIICETVDAWDPKIIGKYSSSHANKWLDFELFETSAQAIEKLQKDHYKLYGTMLDERAITLDQTDFQKPEKLGLIMGNERAGLSPQMQKALDHKIAIPMKGFTQSFNVSVACAICLWELSKQRNKLTLDKDAQKVLIEQFQKNQ